MYNVTLTVSGSLGSDSETKTNFIVITDPLITPPVANFTGSPTSGPAPLTVNFTDTSTGSPTSWHWEFGDGTGSDIADPVHPYPHTGNYTVTLTASNSAGRDTLVKIGYINVGSPETYAPVADFDANPRSGQAPLPVQFSDASSVYPTAWIWRFGDGGYAEVQNPVHTYLLPGNYTVDLIVRNQTGSDRENKPAYVNVTPAEEPVVVSVTPAVHRHDGRAFPVTVTGSNFQTWVNGTHVVLWRAAPTKNITASRVDVTSATGLSCRIRIPLTARTGLYNVTVINPDGQRDTLVNCFRVKT